MRNFPLSFYQKRLQKFEKELIVLKKKSLWISIARLIVFLLLIVALYFFHESTGQVLLIFMVWIPVFLFLVSKSGNISKAIGRNKAYQKINRTEIQILEQKPTDLADGSQFINTGHAYSYDIDLFGTDSFFQYINRSYNPEVQTDLASLLTANDINQIEQKQEAVKELAQKPEWRQDFMAGVLTLENTKPSTEINQWFSGYKPFTHTFTGYLTLVFSILSIGILAGFYTHTLPNRILYYWLIFGLFVVGIFAKKIHRLYQGLDYILPSLISAGSLIELIEKESFNSHLLSQKQKEIQSKNKPASQILTQLFRWYNRKEMAQNIVIKFLGNSLFLYDLLMAYQLEKWIKQYGKDISYWLENLRFFETQISLGNFAFNHPTYTYPKLINDKLQIKAEQLGHPLIAFDKRVTNNFSIHPNEFYIITGANMAGKSTFLRTVSLSIVMANTGLPVCATSYSYQPIKLITSMRTSDSLSSDSSYFFSELTRLKYIVDQIATGAYFIVLDEILKGTNSKDKAMGSKQFLERLTQSKATGIIATHDLSLCSLADEYPQIKNFFFDAAIIDDELYFDYRLKTGICQNMNASFLLRKMNII